MKAITRVCLFSLVSLLVVSKPVIQAELPEAVHAVDPRSGGPTLQAIALSNGWPIQTFVLNNRGSVAFTAGGFVAGDAIILVNQDQFLKVVSRGDPVPGTEGGTFDRFGGLALNDHDQIVFGAGVQSGGLFPSSGVFLYSSGIIKRVVGFGDPAPGSGGGFFSSIEVSALNGKGVVLLRGLVASRGTPSFLQTGLFLFEGDQLRKVVSHDDLAPNFPNAQIDIEPVSLDDEGKVVFFSPAYGIFQWVAGVLTRLAPYDRSAQAVNAQGDMIVQSSPNPTGSTVSFRLASGLSVPIAKDKEPAPLGGTFALTFLSHGTFNINDSEQAFPVSPVLNAYGKTVFEAPMKGGPSDGALFSFTLNRGVRKVVASGDPVPGTNATQLNFFTLNTCCVPSLFNISYWLNGLGMTAMMVPNTGVFLSSATETFYKIALTGESAPGAPGELFSSFLNNSVPMYQGLRFNDAGQIAFKASLAGGPYTLGIFLATFPSLGIQNGGFEQISQSGLPASWQTTWSTSRTGQVFTGTDLPFEGRDSLRLRVGPDGGWTFALSDPIAVQPETTYLTRSRMRFNLSSTSDAVSFAVYQYDSAGNFIAYEEATGLTGDNTWEWQPKGLMLTTAGNAASVRIRFGLISSTENYLDVDDVR